MRIGGVFVICQIVYAKGDDFIQTLRAFGSKIDRSIFAHHPRRRIPIAIGKAAKIKGLHVLGNLHPVEFNRAVDRRQ